MKRTLFIFTSLVFITPLFSQVLWKDLDTRGGLVYGLGRESPYTGVVVDFNDNGNPKIKGRYKDGLMSGMWTYYYPDGIIKAKGRFLRGDGGNISPVLEIPQNGRNGKWIIYYPSRKVNAEYQYVNGEFDKEWVEWYENGQKKRHYFYNKGKRDQTWIAWWPNGNRKIEGNFKKGLKDGQFTFWYENGQKKMEGVCRNDKLLGEWTYYNDDGSTKKVIQAEIKKELETEIKTEVQEEFKEHLKVIKSEYELEIQNLQEELNAEKERATDKITKLKKAAAEKAAAEKIKAESEKAEAVARTKAAAEKAAAEKTAKRTKYMIFAGATLIIFFLIYRSRRSKS